MTPQVIGLIGMGALIVLTFARVPLGAAMGIVGLAGYAAIDGWTRALVVFGTTPFSLSVYAFSVLPLFILMGAVATRSGMSQELFIAANAVFAGRRGALPMATIGACAGFSAISGSSIATAATFTPIAVPEMRRFGYDLRLATGSIAAAGTLGILIPPSVIMVIYALAAEVSVPALFAAGMIPGILLAFLFIVVVWVIAQVRPDWAPASPPLAWRERVRGIRAMWKLGLLFAFAIGGMPDMIEHQQNGYLAADVSGRGLAAGLAWCLQDTDRLAALSAAARQVAEQRFDVREKAGRYLQLFAELTTGPRPAPAMRQAPPSTVA